MSKKGSESQFQYWDLRRRGSSQSDISRTYSISRQAVFKAIHAQDRNVELRLLQFAESSGILVEWYDPALGILIGIIPPLGDILSILIIDRDDRIRQHYDPDAVKGWSGREKAWDNLRSDFRSVLGEGFDLDMNTKALVEYIVSKGGIRE
jgi:hypothetical protein